MRVEADHERAIVVMAKLPRPGLVNTRMTPAISADQAAALQSAFLLDLLTRKLPGAKHKSLWIADAEPLDGARPLGAFPLIEGVVTSAGWSVHAQAGDGLGERMRAAASSSFDNVDAGGACPRRVLVLGTDAPGLPLARMEEALEALDTSDAVVIPAYDGGYVGIALRRAALGLFDPGIPWGSESVLRATMERAEALGLRVARLSPWRDLDTVADLRAFALRFDANETRAVAVSAARTLSLLQKWFNE